MTWPIRHKFNAIRTETNGYKCGSKKEAKYLEGLLLARRSGELCFFLFQVPFHLKSGVRYIVDFVEFWKSGEVRFVDTKGYRTAMYKVKKKLVESEYPVKILEV